MADPSGERQRALEALRDRLDAIDDTLLDLIGERLGVLDEVAALKALGGLRLFHREREDEIIGRKRGEARARGQDPDFVENLFRSIILESHRRQSETILATPDPDTKVVAIVGGRGQIGAFFRGVFERAGHEALVADLETTLTPAEAARRADITVVSVPIAVTREAIEAVGPSVREDALLMDVTSLKEAPVEAMLANSVGEVIGAHPMFGPGVGSLNRQVVALCPARGEGWLAWLRALLEKQGAEIIETTPETHDRAMAVIQVLRHFATIAMGRALAQMGVDIEESLRFTSPIYRLELMMTGRLFAQDPELYADIEMGNPRRAEVLSAYEAAVRETATLVRDGDRDAFIGLFQDVSDYFGPFKERALEESAYLIDRMVERM